MDITLVAMAALRNVTHVKLQTVDDCCCHSAQGVIQRKYD